MASTTTGYLDADLDKDTLQAITEHIVLPPRLPQQAPDQESEDSVEGAISALAAASARSYASEVEEDQREFWTTMADTLDQFASMVVMPLVKSQVEKTLRRMKVNSILVFHIHEQNAALMVRKLPSHTSFEAFEVSAPTSEVMGCTGKLVRVLPGSAVQITNKVVKEDGFLDQVAATLSSMDVEQFGDAVATSEKANSNHHEIRDSAHPKYITELFMGILRGYGQYAKVKIVKKRVADEVLWNKALRPWRRSRAWFIIRVLLQTSVQDNAHYKAFIIHFLTGILGLCTGNELDSDLLYVTRAKIARRVQKLRPSGVPSHVLDPALDVALRCDVLLQSRWSGTRADWKTFNGTSWMPQILDIEADTEQTLPTCGSILFGMLYQQPKRGALNVDTPAGYARHQYADFNQYSFGRLDRLVKQASFVALADFERSVLDHLQEWTNNEVASRRYTTAATTLQSCFDQYYAAFRELYDLDVADQSMAVLTILLLWSAIDMIAVAHIPLLSQFSPELHEQLASSLLLSGQTELEAIHTVEEHIRQRRIRAPSAISVFSNRHGLAGFSARFFRNSREMHALLGRIKRDAEAARLRKRKELQTLNDEHAKLVTKIESMEHDDVTNPKSSGTQHWKKRCGRCKLEKQAAQMKITVHEWPLPSDDCHAQMVVFELVLPAVFSCWRDVTYAIMHDMGLTKPKGHAGPEMTLMQEKQLLPYRSFKHTSRVTLASSTKPVYKSHYATKSLPASEASVLVETGLDFRLYDATSDTWIPLSFESATFECHGTQVISATDSLYTHLQYAISSTAHSTNQVIADRSSCPVTISLQEHDSFGSLRSGARIQWLNILRELHDCALTFRHEEIYTLMSQAAWQVGELSENGGRSSHEDLLDDAFANRLLEACTELLEAVRSNWVETSTVRTLTMLICRLVAARSGPDSVTRLALDFLQDARETTFAWLTEVKQGANADNEDSSESLKEMICELATACRMTYDVRSQDLKLILARPINLRILVESSVALSESRPEFLEEKSMKIRTLYRRDERLSQRLEEHLVAGVLSDRSGFDTALSNIWVDYSPRPNPPEVYGQWLRVYASSSTDNPPQEVCYHTLSGQLLVNGAPLGRLPTQYTSHAFYKRVFGNTTFDVIPGNHGGYDYVTRSNVLNGLYQFSWSLQGATLRICARSETNTWELVPHEILREDFPASVIDDFCHWMDLTSGHIEFRPLARRWNSSSDNWRMSLTARTRIRMTRSVQDTEESFVNYGSCTFLMVSSMLIGLEERSAIFMVRRSVDGGLVATMPRHRLQFILKDQHLESIHYPGMYVDEEQSCGTFVGLRDQLVLRPKPSHEGYIHRQVLIPYGEVMVSREGHHVYVSINKSSNDQHGYYAYVVDTHMGRLSGETSLSSRLFKIYLHAVTSHCLADPLTGRTGVEEALEEMSGAATQGGFTKLTALDLELLDCIGSLSPRRDYYPPHLRCMESVRWSTVPLLAQHPGFAGLASAMLDYALALHAFDGLSTSAPIDALTQVKMKLRREESLVTRSTARINTFYPPGVADRVATERPRDVIHSCRDLCANVNEVQRSIATSTALLEVRQPQALATALSLKAHLLEHTLSLDGPDVVLDIGYSSMWLSVSPASWLSIYEAVRRVSPVSSATSAQHRLAFSLATMAWAAPPLRKLVPLLALLSLSSSSPTPPQWPSYQISTGSKVIREDVLQKVEMRKFPMDRTPVGVERKQPGETSKRFTSRRRELYATTSRNMAVTLVDHFMKQHPLFGALTTPRDDGMLRAWFDLPACTDSVESYFLATTRNQELFTHLDNVYAHLRQIGGHAGQTRRLPPTTCDVNGSARRSSLSADVQDFKAMTLNGQVLRTTSTLARLPNLNDLCRTLDLETVIPESSRQERSANMLGHIIERIREAAEHDSLEDLHSQKLQRSLLALDSHAAHDAPLVSVTSWADLTKAIEDSTLLWETCWSSRLAEIKHILKLPEDGALSKLDHVSVIAPRVGLRTLLRLLAHDRRRDLPIQVHGTLRGLAVAYMTHQHACRLWRLATQRDLDGFSAEYASWRTDTHRETLDDILLQIEGNFRIREHQLMIAREMIQPSASRSTIMQLNMGEGKSSVIIPMIVTAVADGHQFARVVVLKALSAQMFHILVTRLAGLVNRRVYYMPFSRQVDLSSNETVATIHSLMRRCAAEGGVLLALPEHLLSFKLKTIDRQLQFGSLQQAHTMTGLKDMHNWVLSHSRDVIDEADAVLDVKYQLVYTSGAQRPLDDSPDRWVIIQQFLSLVAATLADLKDVFPNDIEYRQVSEQCFPFVRILRTPALPNILHATRTNTIEMVLNGGIQNLNLSFVTEDHDRSLLLRVLAHRHIDEVEFGEAKQLCGTAWKGCLLIRGMLAFGVLEHVLTNKRYRVNYGLCAERSRLAVPYAAKDIPTLRSEFSHPDVAITLTCLSYYYAGLTEKQLLACFHGLLQTSDPEFEFQTWVLPYSNIPSSLRRLTGINTRDVAQFRTQVYPIFAFNHSTIDFFLAHAVFPKEAKEYSHKLATSGWDLVQKKHHLITGFSGTNDRQYLLPTSITQTDFPRQASTNALVLSNLLQEENDSYHQLCGIDGVPLTTKEFLRVITQQTPSIRIVLDVGAQMLELRNQDFAAYWLSLHPEGVLAAVFFDDQDELVVLSHDGSMEALESSPYKQSMEKVVVYLDDAHTRGTDLQLPKGTRAAVTLGPDMTKDRLVQGCMRMRQLGRGHSVAFFVPTECDARIRAVCNLSTAERVHVQHIVRWVMQATCEDIRHYAPHWVQQGIDHARRVKADEAYRTSHSWKVLSKAWVTKEGHTLDEMYGLQDTDNSLFNQASAHPALHRQLQKLRIGHLHNPHIDEEQEREITHEIELERKMVRPVQTPALTPRVHPDVRSFVLTGVLPSRSDQFRSLFKSLRTSPIDEGVWSQSLLATFDFSVSTSGPESGNTNLCPRPLRWLVSTKFGGNRILVAMSPFEVNELMPLIRKSSVVHLHLYVPKVIQSMRSFSDLQYHTIPSLSSTWKAPSLAIQSQLNLFAGQLFIDSWEAYVGLCAFLGVYSRSSPRLYGRRRGIHRNSDGFIRPSQRSITPALTQVLKPYEGKSFERSVIQTLKEHVNSTRNGKDFLRTHIGQLLHGRLLAKKDFE